MIDILSNNCDWSLDQRSSITKVINTGGELIVSWFFKIGNRILTFVLIMILYNLHEELPHPALDSFYRNYMQQSVFDFCECVP